MARQTRAQRRARRGQTEPALAGGRPTPPARRASAKAQPEPARAREEPRKRGGGWRGFVGESWAELKKVEWPGQSQLIQGVIVVLVACIVVGVYLYGADLVFKRVVENVFLR